jgi:hypothetical protein
MFDQRLASAARATARIRLEALVKHLQKINLSPFSSRYEATLPYDCSTFLFHFTSKQLSIVSPRTPPFSFTFPIPCYFLLGSPLK